MRTFNQIVTEILHIDEADIRDNLTARDVPNWDSINYLLFIAELEKEFQVNFTMDEVLNNETLGSVKNTLKSKGVTV